MEIKRDIRLAVGSILAFQIIIAFGTIALLERMSPAILRILSENVASIESAEEMLAALARPSRPGTPKTAELEKRFNASFAGARANITEENEGIPLNAIAANASAAFAGDDAAREAVVDAIQVLSRVNREAMVRSDQEARRLGTAGVWVIVLLGFLGFLAGAISMRRLYLRVIRPVGELCSAITSWRQGDHLRRCEILNAPLELRNAMQLINDLMDEHTTPALPERQETRNRERAVLLHLLEREQDPAVIVDYYGNIAAANNRAIRMLSGSRGDQLRDQLSQVPMGQAGPDLGAVAPIRGIHWWQVTLKTAENIAALRPDET